MTFTIVTDSTADLPKKWIEDYKLTVLGLTIQMDGKTYETVGEQALTSDALLEQMKNGSQPTTSQVNAGQFETVFTEFAQKGEAVLYVAFSSGLSGTYQSAVIAKEMVLERYPEAVIELFDTKAASIGEGYLVLQAGKARDAGKTLTETVELLEELAPRLRTYLLVDDLNHLVRGGRLSKAAALVGGLVNIKPLISINPEGKLDAVAKIRGRKKGVKEMIALTLKDLADDTVLITYTDDYAAAEDLSDQLLASGKVRQTVIEPLGPIIATHIGHNSLVLISVGKHKR